MKKLFIFLILGLLIVSSLVATVNNSENKIWIEKTRADIIVDINDNGDYTSIQDAIDNASSGDTIGSCNRGSSAAAAVKNKLLSFYVLSQHNVGYI